jgi:DNA-binding MarR family transcriptional regulator
MPRNSPQTENFAGDDQILLGVLTTIDRDSNTTQRSMSQELGVALGLANAYLKRCVRKGLVKIQQVPRRRYVYYLTPQGFAEKARLTGQYLSASFQFFRRAREQMSELMGEASRNGHRRIAIAGISELADVAILAAQNHQIAIVAIIDDTQAGQSYFSIPVVASLKSCEAVDAVIVTALTDADAVYRALVAECGDGRVLAPPLLHVSLLSPATEREAAE